MQTPAAIHLLNDPYFTPDVLDAFVMGRIALYGGASKISE